MGKVRFELNYQGVGALLKSEAMKETLRSVADSLASAAGEGYASDTKLMGTRVIASAYADTREARRDNWEHNTLLRALGGAGHD